MFCVLCNRISLFIWSRSFHFLSFFVFTVHFRCIQSTCDSLSTPFIAFLHLRLIALSHFRHALSWPPVYFRSYFRFHFLLHPLWPVRRFAFLCADGPTFSGQRLVQLDKRKQSSNILFFIFFFLTVTFLTKFGPFSFFCKQAMRPRIWSIQSWNRLGHTALFSLIIIEWKGCLLDCLPLVLKQNQICVSWSYFFFLYFAIFIRHFHILHA